MSAHTYVYNFYGPLTSVDVEHGTNFLSDSSRSSPSPINLLQSVFLQRESFSSISSFSIQKFESERGSKL